MGPNGKIVHCPKCGTRNRIGMHSARVRPICARCGTSLESYEVSHSPKRLRFQPATIGLLNILLSAAIVAVGYAIVVTPSLMKEDYSELISRQEQKTKKITQEHEYELGALNNRLEKELANIDAESLRRSADLHYESIMEARKSYDKRYALTLREKAQLRMLGLASDSTRAYHDAITAVAREASPKGSEISVRESVAGIALHIDFDMSSMTSGEHGTRTKHESKESLKKEVVSLISRVTNDLFEFCRGLDLETVHVGCRHYVRTTEAYGTSRDEKMMLYKIRIRKDRIPELNSNPFLDVYSTTAYFEVDQDNFDQIEIVTTRL
jgi:hypothetical protein